MSKRTIAVAIGDIHSGCLFGLMRPGIELPPLDDQGELWSPEPTESQVWLWDCFQEHKAELIKFAGKDDIVVFYGGDVTHGDKYPDKEKVTVRRYDQLHIAVDNLSEIASLKNVKVMRLAKGTGSHVMGHGTAELIVARMLRENYKLDIGVAYHYLSEIQGTTWDIAHHGPGPGIREWTKGNVLRLYTESIMMAELMSGGKPPDVLLRWHYHRYVPKMPTIRSNGGTFTTIANICPSYCFIDDFARQVTKAVSKLTVGMLAYEIVDGKVRAPQEFLSTIDLRKKEVLL